MVYTYIKKKPVIYDTKWIVPILACFALTIILMLFNKTLIYLPIILILAFIIIFIGIILFSPKSISINGVDCDDFNKVFAETLTELNLDYKQKDTLIKIKEPLISIYILNSKIKGKVQVIFKPKSNIKIYSLIISALKKKDIKPNYNYFIYNIFIIFFVIAIGIWVSTINI